MNWFLLGVAAAVVFALLRRRESETSPVAPLALKRWDAPPGQHRLEGHILEWVRKRLRESPAPAREAFDELPLPHRRVFAARRLEAEVAEAGFSGFFRGRYEPIVLDAQEALLAFGAKAHARIVEEALAARELWLPWRRAAALHRATRAFLLLDASAPLMASRARYIESEGEAFSRLG